jgi:hypothetical protein
MRIPTLGHVASVAGVMALPMFLLAGPAWAAPSKSLDEAMSHDGLQRIKVKGVELAYAKPGATLAGYKRVKLDPVEVAFHKSWEPSKTGSNLKLSSAERESIRTGVAKAVQEEFARVLQDKNGYQVVDESGPDVLRVKVNVVNLYVSAPDAGSSMGRSRTYVVSAGEMTLFAELIDSESGDLIARVVDRREARNSGIVSLSGAGDSAAEARAIAVEWARILRRSLDNARDLQAKR